MVMASEAHKMFMMSALALLAVFKLGALKKKKVQAKKKRYHP